MIPPAITSLLCVALVAAVASFARQHGPQAPQEPFSALAAVNPSNAREVWAVDFLAQLGNSAPTRDTVAMVVAWQGEENTSAQFNPLATSQEMDGATLFNSSRVKNYATYADGIAATVRTLQYDYPGYSEVLAGLQTNAPERALAGLASSPWAEEAGYGARVRALWAQGTVAAQSSKCLPTATGAISAHFDDTTSGYWAAQAGGRHNGTDYAGSPGEPVYAPFDLVVEDTQYYGDSGRIGWYIQGRFSDGFLFYAGHLGQALVRVGDRVGACQQIGTIGEVWHTHIKTASPDMPVPCEATGCVNFARYFEEH